MPASTTPEITEIQNVADDLRQDLKYGLRSLFRAPGFTMTAVLTLALGIGANTAIFSALDGVLLKPLPYADQDRLLSVWQQTSKSASERDAVSPANFLDLKERSAALVNMAGIEPYSMVLARPEGPERLPTWLVSRGFFEIVGTPPLLGRTFEDGEFATGSERVVVIGHQVWQDRFGGDPGVLGQVMRLDGDNYSIIGVMPAKFEFPRGRDLWAPKIFDDLERQRRSAAYFQVIARPLPGVTTDNARAGLAAIGSQLKQEYPRDNQDLQVAAGPVADRLVGSVRPLLLVLMGAVSFVLLIACANVANLLLVRAGRREREFAVRAALGAGRWRIARQLLTESVLLALAGGLAGVLLARWGIAAIHSVVPASVPRIDEMRLDVRTLGYAAAVSLFTAVVFGLVPALRAADLDVIGRLKEASRTASGSARLTRVCATLIVSQVALALVLLVGAGLLIRSFVRLLDEDPGFRTDHVLTAVTFSWSDYPKPDQRAAFVQQAVERFGSLPGVRIAAAGSSLPLAARFGPEQATFVIPDVATTQDLAPTARATVATPGYFEVLGISLKAGRPFAWSDDSRAQPVVIINQSLARRYWPNQNPLGKKITLSFAGPPISRDIVGIVADTRHTGLDDSPGPGVYVPHAQAPTGSMAFLLRSDVEPRTVLAPLRAALNDINPALPLSSVATLEELLAQSLKDRRFALLLLGAFSLAALALAGIGIYGVISHVTGERIPEIGIRLALGATTLDVIALVMRQGAILTLLGVAAGLGAAALLTGVLSGMLYQVAPLDPLTFAATAAVLIAIAALACYLPARRATRTDVIRVLRLE